MKQSAKQSNGEDELLWVLLLLIVFVVAVWFIGHEKISRFMMSVRYFETHLMLFDADGRQAIMDWLRSTHPADATLKSLWSSGQVASWELRWYIFTILTVMFGYLLYRAPDRGSRYSQKHNTTTLAKQEAVQWPTILPVLDANLISVSISHPVNGMRSRVRDYGRTHGFLVKTAALGQSDDPADIELIDSKEALRISKVHKILIAQLGKPWEGLDALKPYERALFAAFAAQVNNDNALALLIINDLARAYVRAKKAKKTALINSLRAQKALHEYGNSKIVRKVVSQHAYKRTVLMAMKDAASQNGVIPPNWFRWLKTVDRVTWYCLCDLGMDVASVEAGGPRAQWMAENKAKAPILNPLIEPAVVGIRTALGELLDAEEDI
ncbi:IcmP-like type IV secretion system protein [Pseudomonas sp. WS 5532]|uniref:secretion/conjugation apparatus DotM-related subunit n=1 Tax=Pseudomonas sp. WS 5532 TaxID=2717495 RepID=UPI0014742B30|nr:IcmP-like type IV secretion system protein [Pseudomonas sp. WS 5532]NMX77843.1 IcmP-like type IV secretion system protein [Pseudomonas sp. WS 5532]